MRPILLYILLFLSTTILFNCKKYPEGGCERRGPKNIIGEWKLSLYEVNGIDSTDLINYNGDERYKQISVYKEQTKHNPNIYIRAKGALENLIFFSDHNTTVNITANSSYLGSKSCGGNPITCFKEIFNPEKSDAEWQILKLTKKEFVITSTQNSIYKIKLTK